jgi:hypothetical protein
VLPNCNKFINSLNLLFWMNSIMHILLQLNFYYSTQICCNYQQHRKVKIFVIIKVQNLVLKTDIYKIMKLIVFYITKKNTSILLKFY